MDFIECSSLTAKGTDTFQEQVAAKFNWWRNYQLVQQSINFIVSLAQKPIGNETARSSGGTVIKQGTKATGSKEFLSNSENSYQIKVWESTLISNPENKRI